MCQRMKRSSKQGTASARVGVSTSETPWPTSALGLDLAATTTHCGLVALIQESAIKGEQDCLFQEICFLKENLLDGRPFKDQTLLDAISRIEATCELLATTIEHCTDALLD